MTKRKYSDDELTIMISSDNKDTRLIAYEAFIDTNYKYAMNFLRSKNIQTDDACDIVQEAMLALKISIDKDSFKLNNKLSNYFFGILHHKISDFFASGKNHLNLYDNETDTGSDKNIFSPHSAADIEEFMELVNEFKNDHVKCFWLIKFKLYHNYSHEALVQLFEEKFQKTKTYDAIKQLLFRCKAELRRFLDKNGFDL
ncbi:MAG: hypothetical protein SCALA702_28210 [Melioribacteraceae bacterium]|nr:MAG: hypothetical protein SCALA702_28210 [Melioribacteraceae bacterium]